MHTPGPWNYDWRTECIASPAGWVASLAGHGERKSDIDFGDQNDDGMLMAAAPGLLLACGAAEEYLVSVLFHHPHLVPKTLLVLLAEAIAKTRGEEAG